jgi:hypothetical protein
MEYDQNIESLSDEQLYKKLKAYGVKVGPITKTTRALYERRLKKHLVELFKKSNTCPSPYSLNSTHPAINQQHFDSPLQRMSFNQDSQQVFYIPSNLPPNRKTLPTQRFQQIISQEPINVISNDVKKKCSTGMRKKESIKSSTLNVSLTNSLQFDFEIENFFYRFFKKYIYRFILIFVTIIFYSILAYYRLF